MCNCFLFFYVLRRVCYYKVRGTIYRPFIEHKYFWYDKDL